VLSRVAESLYWVGRYVERAEDTARLLDVHVVGQLDNPWMDLESSSRDMLLVMGLTVPEGVLEPAAAARRLAFEHGSTSSIAGALEAARDGSRSVREALSSELWECLNATYHALPGQEASAAVRGPHPFCRWVRERAAVFAGLLDGSMPRDDSWRFLVLGRSLERVDMTARLLRARAVQSGTSSDWVGLLRCCSAHEAYLRGYRAAVEPERVVEFLVLDRLFPRSVYAALAQAERCLIDLDPSAGRTGLVDDARRLLGRARTDLEYRTSDELLDELPELLDMLQRTVSHAGDALSSRYFHRGGAAHSWTAEVDA
jgi:uncharacterized alpha-E superfamily protein